MEQFRLSQSKLADWDKMCPIEFKAKHIDKTFRTSPTIEMEWGNLFETLAIGGGINGAFEFEKSEFGDKMQRSELLKRVQLQAEACKEWFKMLGGKKLSMQEYIAVDVVDSEGNIIPIEGTLDVRYLMELQVVIDLKLTTDTENDFGKYAWANPEKMDLTQNVHYPLLVKTKYELDYIPNGYYFVFDTKKDMKRKPIRCIVSESTLLAHIERLSVAYQEISFAIMMDDWVPKNTWENCSKCKAPCRFQRLMPEIYEVNL